MPDVIKSSVAAAVKKVGEDIDRDLLEAILRIQDAHQHDQESERRIQEMEQAIDKWCETKEVDENAS